MAPTATSKYTRDDLQAAYRRISKSIKKQWQNAGMVAHVEMGWQLEISNHGARMLVTYHVMANKTTGIYTEVL